MPGAWTGALVVDAAGETWLYSGPVSKAGSAELAKGLAEGCERALRNFGLRNRLKGGAICQGGRCVGK